MRLFAKKNTEAITIAFIIALLVTIRFYRLWHSAPFDYDSVKNFQIIEELSQGNFQNFFHHASPVLYLFFLPFYLIFPNFWFLLLINSIANVLGIFLWVYLSNRSCKREHLMIASLLFGTSFFSVIYSRTLSIETLSLLLSAIFWHQLKTYWEGKNYFWNTPFATGTITALLLMTNYKAIVLLIFVVVIAFIWQEKALRNSFGSFALQVIFVFTATISMFMIVGMIFGLQWYQYPATLLSIFAVAQETPTHPFNGLLYLQYLVEYENPILIFLALWQARQLLQGSNLSSFQSIMMQTALLVFGIMFLLPKAPRGLIFVVPILYLVGINFLDKVLMTKLKTTFLYFVLGGVLVAWQLKTLWEQIYPYSYTNYPQVAEILKSQKAQVVFTTLGIGIYPFLDKSIQLVVLREAADTVKFYEYTGRKFLLYDSYSEISRHHSLTRFKTLQYDYHFEEKSLCNPFLSLENIQYTRFTPQQAKQLLKQLKLQKWQVALKELQ